MIGSQHFNYSVIKNKKIINKNLCWIDLDIKNWRGHIPGQYSEICLTAENGYQAIRPYSIASAPKNNPVGFLIEKIPNGEVSNFFFEVAREGDIVQVSNPIGQRFILQNNKTSIFIASGSGIAPFISMSEHLNQKCDKYYMYHWSKNFSGLVNYKNNETKINSYYFPFITREKPKDWVGGSERINAQCFDNLCTQEDYEVYICGSDSFVEQALQVISKLNINFDFYTERFGS